MVNLQTFLCGEKIFAFHNLSAGKAGKTKAKFSY
jgi:hypothetical protein